MEDFEGFVRRLMRELGVEEAADGLKLSATEEGFERVARVLWAINEFLYVTTRGLPEDTISAHHRFWREHHSEILGLGVDRDRCREVASRLEEVYARHGSRLRPSLPPGISLPPDLIANARLFTAIQDFTIRLRESPYVIAQRRPELFDPKKIAKNTGITDALLRELGAESQYDKRRKFARLCAELLIEKYDGEAANIAAVHGENALRIRENLVANPDERFRGQLGFSAKKANMYVRDLHELGVWPRLTSLEKLDVSSDANTMRVALRLGIVRTRIPLLTSYMDVYCCQYDAIDRAVTTAWRETWTQWGRLHPNHRVAAPAFSDFFVYRVGQICCRPNKRACEVPCKDTRLAELRELVPDSEGFCPFRGLCGADTRNRNPPRSISIYGRTGWTSGLANEGGGGGISS